MLYFSSQLIRSASMKPWRCCCSQQAGVPVDNWVSTVLRGREGREDSVETPSAPVQPDEKKTLPFTCSTCQGEGWKMCFRFSSFPLLSALVWFWAGMEWPPQSSYHTSPSHRLRLCFHPNVGVCAWRDVVPHICFFRPMGFSLIHFSRLPSQKSETFF